ncbi:MAG: outer membrane beta-barrel protein, partial [Coxiellaceae bacterium]|nr:outer membrane beta-barrel protein [Coxiellaceae bacterium]
MFKRKFFTTIFALFLISSPVLAYKKMTLTTFRGNFSGPYITGEAGFTVMNTEINTAASLQGDGSSLGHILWGHMSGTSPTARLGAFYGFQFEPDYFLGVGLTAAYQNAVTSMQAYSDNTATQHYLKDYQSAKLQFNFGAFLQPGILISPSTLVFLSAGALYNQFKYHADTEGERPIFVVAPHSGYIASDKTKWLWGWGLGVGLEHFVQQNIAVIFQYLYTSTKNENVDKVLTNVPTNVSLISNESEFHSHTNQFFAGIAYYFEGKVDSNMKPRLGGFSGFSVSVYTGILNQLTRVTGRYTRGASIDISGASIQPITDSPTNTNINFGLSLAYGELIEDYYVGARASIESTNSPTQVTRDQTEVTLAFAVPTIYRNYQVKLYNYGALDVLIGRPVFHSNMIYILGGAAYGYYKISGTVIEPTRAFASVYKTGALWGIRAGLGFSTKITEHASLSLEDVFTL